MKKINHRNKLYDIVDIININGSYYLIIKRGNDIQYINKEGDKYIIPAKDLSIYKNRDKTLEFIRKQELLQLLVGYIKDRNLYEEASKTVEVFKEYVKNGLIQTFLNWPLIDENDYQKELSAIKENLYYFLDEKMKYYKRINDYQAIIICDDFNEEDQQTKLR